MAKDYIGYQALTDAALRSVVRDALRRIEKQGLIGSHHFYITFKTHFPGVDTPAPVLGAEDQGRIFRGRAFVPQAARNAHHPVPGADRLLRSGRAVRASVQG
jgi:hypothetical protein